MGVITEREAKAVMAWVESQELQGFDDQTKLFPRGRLAELDGVLNGDAEELLSEYIRIQSPTNRENNDDIALDTGDIQKLIGSAAEAIAGQKRSSQHITGV